VTTGYRENALSCSGCSGPLEPKEVADAVIDVCAACGGIWVDWFDGDLVEMVRGAPALDGVAAPERAGTSACPRCQRPLEWERYQDSRAEILRCADCAGAFVPRSSVGAIVSLAGPGAERPPLDPMSKLALVLQRWLGWDDRA
jgi:Zn-finger nucleic acid-binding protein